MRLANATRIIVSFFIVASMAIVPTFGCNIPEEARKLNAVVDLEAIMMAAHGHTKLEKIAYQRESPAPCTGGMADIFPCQNVDLMAFLPLSSVGGGGGNDNWGWTDPLDGKEYAIFGRTNGTAFVDISDPANPIYLGNLPTRASSAPWRDIKTYANHAFIVADFAGNHGMQVFDLTQLRNVASPPVTFTETAHYDGFSRSHNIVINTDSGFAYAVGGDETSCNGGLHMIDIRNPIEPTFAGCFSADGYTHDAQCITYSGPDTAYQGRELCFASNEDTLTIVDVTDKQSPVQVARQGYVGSGFTHQGWLNGDQTRWVHDDERDELNFGHNTKTYVWDVSDIDNPFVLDTFIADGAAVDHNQYLHNGHAYQANY
ncbi:MAG: choice-of-anchor B family protein, partial [Acidobacteriota bacterium]